MNHMDERRIALMTAEVIGAETLIDSYFNNDGERVKKTLEEKIGKGKTTEFLGLTAINLRNGIFPTIQKTLQGAYPLESSVLSLDIDYSKEAVEEMEVIEQINSRTR